MTSLTREQALTTTRSSQDGVASLGLGAPPSQAAPYQPVASTSQSRSSSGSSRARGASVHFAGDPLPHESQQSRNRSSAVAPERNQEPPRRSHLVVPGAPPARKVVPPRIENDFSTPRGPPPQVLHTPQVPYDVNKNIYWPPHLQQYAPHPDSPCVWTGPPDEPHEVLPNEVPMASILGRPLAQVRTVTNAEPPVIPPPPPDMERVVPPVVPTVPRAAADTGSINRISPPNPPMAGRSPMAWRPGPAHRDGYVAAYEPEIGIKWIPEEEAAKLPVRARGTESRFPYVIAIEPSEVDDEWRKIHDGASPGANPLQLSGVPEAPVAGPSTSVVHRRGQYEPLPGSSAAVSTLFRNPPGTSDRTITANSSNASINGMGILAPPPAGSARSAGRRTSPGDASDPLGLNLASFPEPRDIPPASQANSIGPEPSPASTWGTIPTPSTRNSSLNNLNIQNLPEPHPFPRPYESLDQLPIGEFNGGPIVLTDAITPRHSQHASLFGDNASVSGRSQAPRGLNAETSGLLLNPSAGSSRQVVSSLRDLEDVNRSLLQIAHTQDREETRERDSRREAPRSSRPSVQHSRQMSMSGHDTDEALIGPRTGIALYSSRVASDYTSTRVSIGPSPPEPSPPASSRPRSGASSRSHAESTSSSYSHQSIHSLTSANSQRMSDPARDRDRRRSRRSSNAVLAQIVRDDYPPPAPSASWTAAPADMQPYASSSRAPYSSQHVDAQKSAESVPRTMGSLEGLSSVPGSLSSLLLNFGPENNTAAVNASGEEAAGIVAPRPVNGRRSSMFGSAWSARSGR